MRKAGTQEIRSRDRGEEMMRLDVPSGVANAWSADDTRAASASARAGNARGRAKVVAGGSLLTAIVAEPAKPASRARILILFSVLALIVVMTVKAGEAHAAPSCGSCRPWWHVVTVARPTYLHSGVAENELQTVVTSPNEEGLTDFVFFFEVAGPECARLRREGAIVGCEVRLEFASHPEGAGHLASAESVQESLEAEVYGPHNVAVRAVTNGPTTTYEIENMGLDAARRLPPLRVLAEAGEAEWSLTRPGQADGQVVLIASNLGDATADAVASPVRLEDILPPGLVPVEVESVETPTQNAKLESGESPLACEFGDLANGGHSVGCAFAGSYGGPNPEARRLTPFGALEVRIGVNVGGAARSGEMNSAIVSGGGALSAAVTRRPITISSEPVPFAFENYEVTPEEEGGNPTTQAGSHPFQLTVNIGFDQEGPSGGLVGEPHAEPAGLPRNVRTQLPPGLIGNPRAVPQCPTTQFDGNLCPTQTVVGVAQIRLNEPTAAIGLKTTIAPVYNLEPKPGEPARFGIPVVTKEIRAFIDTSLSPDGSYSIVGESSNLPQVAGILGAQITLWGVPGDPRHDASRGLCVESRGECGASGETTPTPFLTMPTSCTGTPLRSVAEADSWEQSGAFVSASTERFEGMPTMSGCARLPFSPGLEVSPSSGGGSTPIGYSLALRVPQDGSGGATGLATSAVRDVEVALPKGIVLNPAAADGLGSCSEPLIGYLGRGETDPVNQPGISQLLFTQKLPGAIGSGTVLEPGGNFCADASKIGKAKITTPLLAEPLVGSVYVAAQEANPFGSIFAMYIAAEARDAGVAVKLAGEIVVGAGGQITVKLEGNPQVPFEEALIGLFSGPRAVLSSPAQCGSYSLDASLTPWSAAFGSSVQRAQASASFTVTGGPNGAACPGATLPFAPQVEAGVRSTQAGAYSPLVTDVQREDGTQALSQIAVKAPKGLLANLSGVALCPNAAAEQGDCGSRSLIGEATVRAGFGPEPITLPGGRMYLTEGYEGGTFGLSITAPAKAGPYDLAATKDYHPSCDCVVVRAKVAVDPVTTQIEITTSPSGDRAIPLELDDVPLSIREVAVTANRHHFVVGPTNCTAAKFETTVRGEEGASSVLSTPFQMANCAALQFKPDLKLFLSGKVRRAGHPALKAVLNQPKEQNANIARTSVILPKGMLIAEAHVNSPCTRVQFNSTSVPGEGCPPESVLGTAKVWTPLLENPEEGKVYFRSNGGERELPDLVVALRGQIPVQLVGFIDSVGRKNAEERRLRTRFQSVPDAPVSRFELKLLGGARGLLENSHNICKGKDLAKFQLTGQNGKTYDTESKVQVACGKGAKHTKKH